MDINKVLKERQKWFEWKNIKPIYEKIVQWQIENKQLNVKNVKLNDIIEITLDENKEKLKEIEQIAKMLKPWRKGPFKINDLFIDTEWRSFIKWNIIKPHINLENKDVLDVGCNNGYYMFRMLEMNPKSITGFDPSALFNLQFEFINNFIKSDIEYKLLGVEHIPFYDKKFDTIFCLGVLYHRPDPITMLKELKAGLNPGGEVILDTLIIEGDEEIALCPVRYQKMKNVYFIPTLKALYNWIEKAKFKDVKFIGKRYTDLEEQRKTDWIEGESLNNFLNEDLTKTVEGYPPPLRVYLKLKN
ncbi:generic methyltransferase [Nautilia profundicola AmH]|uniref:tRNA U34 carboxymethyltransferase n=1 Tax=Nautilia profundicola (strain ATCC BAA-1463 / DSM 18972 / AmH) TaxID=598659 RepID=CMOB_NAUPA|nr:tRNA 5-methoxyuridine(34)/uridine 5-oxyacetic acid(34) synthase CmoB [Nautilia profundicola]B9L8G5.1 RecName: Full=tRNA U34 carboxymethyltransferase [Nautilia profundicola AmH]ACM93533.1 generic methyltransferase [Nautilia profundicola AmH]